MFVNLWRKQYQHIFNNNLNEIIQIYTKFILIYVQLPYYELLFINLCIIFNNVGKIGKKDMQQ